MLNRHAIVLFFGSAALGLLRAAPLETADSLGMSSLFVFMGFGPLGVGFLLLLVGLFIEDGKDGARALLGQVCQLVGIVLLGLDAALKAALGEGAMHLVLAEAGIAVASLGVVLEMRLAFRWLRLCIGMQIVGDLLYLVAVAWSVLGMNQRPSTTGWAFIAIAGLLGVYAALVNLALQVRRVLDVRSGWRFRVTRSAAEGIDVHTPSAPAHIPWQTIEAVQAIDRRHLLLVLPSPLPKELEQAELPLEQLRVEAEPTVGPPDGSPPARYALVLHEQELGVALPVALRRLQEHLTPSARAPATAPG